MFKSKQELNGTVDRYEQELYVNHTEVKSDWSSLFSFFNGTTFSSSEKVSSLFHL